jgi:hypothetical protein
MQIWRGKRRESTGVQETCQQKPRNDENNLLALARSGAFVLCRQEWALRTAPPLRGNRVIAGDRPGCKLEAASSPGLNSHGIEWDRMSGAGRGRVCELTSGARAGQRGRARDLGKPGGLSPRVHARCGLTWAATERPGVGASGDAAEACGCHVN